MFNEEEFPGLSAEMEQFVADAQEFEEKEADNILTMPHVDYTMASTAVDRAINNLIVTYGEEEIVKHLKAAIKQVEEQAA